MLEFIKIEAENGGCGRYDGNARKIDCFFVSFSEYFNKLNSEARRERDRDKLYKQKTLLFMISICYPLFKLLSVIS